MNLNSREIHWLNIKSFFNRCCRYYLNCFCYLVSERLSCTFDHLFGYLSCVWAFVSFALGLSTHFSVVHTVVIICARNIRLLFKLLLKFRNVLKHTESRSSVACNQNIKEDIPTALEVYLCLKRNINRSSTKTSRQHESNIRGRTMFKNNLRGITLVRGPIWRTHSLTLTILLLKLRSLNELIRSSKSSSGSAITTKPQI